MVYKDIINKASQLTRHMDEIKQTLIKLSNTKDCDFWFNNVLNDKRYSVLILLTEYRKLQAELKELEEIEV